MLVSLMKSLTKAEREAMGVAAIASLGDITRNEPEATKPVTLITGEAYFKPLNIRLHTRDLRQVYQDAFPSGFLTETLKSLVSSFNPVDPTAQKDHAKATRPVSEPSHALLEMSRISSTGTTLFDCQQEQRHPIVMRLSRAEDNLGNSDILRMDGEKLLEVMVSEHQYTRLIRCDHSLTPCTISQRGWTRYNLDDNPHLKDDMPQHETKNEVRQITSAENACLQELARLLEEGVTRKSDRDEVIKVIENALSNMGDTTQALHEFAEKVRERAYYVAEKRHGHIVTREVDSLPSGMQQKLKQLALSGNTTALMLSLDDNKP